MAGLRRSVLRHAARTVAQARSRWGTVVAPPACQQPNPATLISPPPSSFTRPAADLSCVRWRRTLRSVRLQWRGDPARRAPGNNKAGTNKNMQQQHQTCLYLLLTSILHFYLLFQFCPDPAETLWICSPLCLRPAVRRLPLLSFESIGSARSLCPVSLCSLTFSSPAAVNGDDDADCGAGWHGGCDATAAERVAAAAVLPAGRMSMTRTRKE